MDCETISLQCPVQHLDETVDFGSVTLKRTARPDVTIGTEREKERRGKIDEMERQRKSVGGEGRVKDGITSSKEHQ